MRSAIVLPGVELIRDQLEIILDRLPREAFAATNLRIAFELPYDGVNTLAVLVVDLTSDATVRVTTTNRDDCDLRLFIPQEDFLAIATGRSSLMSRFDHGTILVAGDIALFERLLQLLPHLERLWNEEGTSSHEAE
jgi:alkyl sulfatase BDS1-like metallo-beta-lactamase superfamily hydrolase